MALMVAWQWLIVAAVLGLGLGAAIGFAVAADYIHRHERRLENDMDTSEVSDGYHTFGELYDHRRALTAALCKAVSLYAWRSKAHHPDDSPMFDGGYFIVGINLPTGTITYHYKLSHWDDFAGVIELEHAPKWDGAAPGATVERLLKWARA